ncbi:MAG: hypothetical protein GF346_03395, partial [Candidatus Eisenbacteria bacterium]|nr:hypothetical protein [Candidatus Latescibacterota bacterium]MBD3301467.1 hypothetical protein [Candidatus Eisenbacteria bacterium]
MPHVHRFAILLALIAFSLTAPTAPLAETWDEVMGEPTVFMNDLCMLPDGDHGWAVGTTSYGGEVLSSIVRTTDGGADWERLDFAYETSAALNGVAFVSTSRGWVVGEQGRIFATTDGGATWTPQTSGTNRKLSKVFFLDAQQGWITGGWGDGSSYLVLKTTDGGTSWQNQSFGSTCHSNEDICFADPLNGWIVGRDSSIEPQIHRTTDGGQSWVRQTVPQGAGIPVGVDFVSSSEG